MKGLNAFLCIGGCLVAWSATASGEQSARSETRQPVEGVVSLDVYTSGTTVDVLTVVASGDEKRLEHQRSTDGGSSWGPLHVIDVGDSPISIASRGNGPQVVAHDEHVAVHWSTTGDDRFGAGPMATAVSHDGGATWAPGPNPAADGTRGGQNFADMAADPAGTYYVAWIGSHDGPARRALGIARSTDFGETWGFRQLVDESSCACCWNRISAPSPGVARVLYRDHGIRDMALATTTDSGEHWSLDGPVGDFGWAFDGCPHLGGGIAATHAGDAERVHAVVWTGHAEKHGLYLVRSDDQGATWSPPDPLGGELARHSDIAGAGRTVVVAWDESRAIWRSVSRDQGQTWGAPLRLSAEGQIASHPIVAQVGVQFAVFWTERGADNRLTWRSRRVGASWTGTSTGGDAAP